MEKFLGLPVIGWAVLCLALSTLFVFVFPQSRPGTISPSRAFILRWFHPLVWLLLAISLFIRIFGRIELANPVALLALPVYLIFVVALVMK